MFEHGYALLIGVDQNEEAKLALPIVKKDITKLKEVITHPERCGYNKENVLVLTGPDATRAQILGGLKWLKSKLEADSDPNQTAFIFYSGHGHREPAGEAFLIPYDFCWPMSLGGLPAKAFAEMIANLHPRRLLVVMDCCHAESMEVKGVSESGVAAVAVTPDTPGLGVLAEGEGRAVLSSSRGSQQSWIRSDGQMSVFTYHLVEALTGHAGRLAWPEVTVTEVMEYVGRTVPVTARTQHQAEQEPVFRYAGTAFPIALVMGGKGVEKGVAAPDPLAALPLLVRSTLAAEEIEGEATNVDIGKMGGGQVEATTTAKTVKRGGKLTGVKIGTLDNDMGGFNFDVDLEQLIASGGAMLCRDSSRAEPKAKRPQRGKRPSERGAKSVARTMDTEVQVGEVTGGEVIGTQTNLREGDAIHENQVNVAAGGQASVKTGISGQVQIHGPVTIIQGSTGTPANTPPTVDPHEPTIEEKVRLDVATPPSAVVNEPFDVVVAVKQVTSPPLSIADLERVVSAEGSVFRYEEHDIVQYRIEVTGVNFQITPSSYQLELRPGTDARPVAFQVTATKTGKRSLLVNAYQEDGALAAQTRLIIEVVIAVTQR